MTQIKTFGKSVRWAEIKKQIEATPIKQLELRSPNPPSLSVYYLGTFLVYQDEQAIEVWTNNKGKSVFKYLVAHRLHPVHKELLMELFWPEANPAVARNNLNVAIYGLRQTLRRGRPDFSHILFQEDQYLVNPEMNLWVDFEEFTSRIRAAQDKELHGDLASAILEYQKAEPLYQGEYLQEDRYEDWLFSQRQNLENHYLELLDRLSSYSLNQRDYPACISFCKKMLAVDPCWEEAHQRLMISFNQQGQRFLAMHQYHWCLKVLKKELNLPLSLETTDLYRQISQSH